MAAHNRHLLPSFLPYLLTAGGEDEEQEERYVRMYVCTAGGEDEEQEKWQPTTVARARLSSLSSRHQGLRPAYGVRRRMVTLLEPADAPK